MSIHAMMHDDINNNNNDNDKFDKKVLTAKKRKKKEKTASMTHNYPSDEKTNFCDGSCLYMP